MLAAEYKDRQASNIKHHGYTVYCGILLKCPSHSTSIVALAALNLSCPSSISYCRLHLHLHLHQNHHRHDRESHCMMLCAFS